MTDSDVDDAKLADWHAEAMANPPNPADWANLVVALRLSERLAHKSGQPFGGLPPAIVAPRFALARILEFLELQHCVMQYGASQPLVRLYGAIVDLADGRVDPMFRPSKRRPGNPGTSVNESLLIGLSTRAMSELMTGGMSEREAARRVEQMLGKTLNVTAAKVRNWRARLNEGRPGGGKSQEALNHYNAALPSGEARARGEQLLLLIRQRVVSSNRDI